MTTDSKTLAYTRAHTHTHMHTHTHAHKHTHIRTHKRAAHSWLKLHEIDAFNLWTKTSFPLAQVQVSGRASEQMTAAERASEASRAESK